MLDFCCFLAAVRDMVVENRDAGASLEDGPISHRKNDALVVLARAKAEGRPSSEKNAEKFEAIKAALAAKRAFVGLPANCRRASATY
jgi:hypothetical protein